MGGGCTYTFITLASTAVVVITSLYILFSLCHFFILGSSELRISQTKTEKDVYFFTLLTMTCGLSCLRANVNDIIKSGFILLSFGF